MTTLTLCYLIACAAVCWACFCRLVVTTRATALPVRMAFIGVGASAAAAIFGVLFWGYSPQWPDVLNQAAVASMLAVASAYRRPHSRPAGESSR